MPIRKTELVNGEFYHIVNRGVDKRDIFLDDKDRFRFINSLLVFNDEGLSEWHSNSFWKQAGPSCLINYESKNPLVEICVFALMKNHFHLLVRQLIDGGIISLMNKLGGYSAFFNKKYERKGALFEGRYKIKLIKTEEQLKNNFVYIHTNPVEIIEPKWKDALVDNPQEAIKFLEDKYIWSSYRDYLGKEKFSRLINQDFFLKLFGEKEELKKQIDSWILFKSSNKNLQ
jgi:putative transposase